MLCVYKNTLSNRIKLLLSGILTCSSAHVFSAQFELAGFDINFDSTFTLGTSYRVESRNPNLIGKNNQPNIDWAGYAIVDQRTPEEVALQRQQFWDGTVGSYSANGDLGNLNHDRGDAFSRVFTGIHELDINKDDWGFFTRFTYFYDQAAIDNKGWTNPLTGQEYDLCADPQASERVCKDFRFLDAFIYGNFDIGDIPVSIRLGDQVVSWGESALISHGLNAINPVDIARLRAPGSELKEAFIPVGMLWTSIGLTDNISLDAFYQYDWQETILPAPGSYFSTNDFAGEGGQFNNIQSGFTQYPDINPDYLVGFINNAIIPTATNPQLPPEVAQGTAALMIAGMAGKVALRNPDADIKPSNSGQYGLKLAIYSPELNDTEFGLYYMNYHSRRPLISGKASNFTPQSLGADLGYVLTQPNFTTADLYNLNAFTHGFLEYPEDIKLYGFSFNTGLNETAIAGEIAYRQDEPLQVDDVELIYAGIGEQLANANIRPQLKGISQIQNVMSGEVAKGYILSDTIQTQASVTHLFGPNLGADSIAVLVEAGIVKVLDMPNPDVMRLNSPGNARAGALRVDQIQIPPVLPTGVTPEIYAAGLQKQLSNGAETTPFPSETAWGYKAVVKMTYNNVFSGVNLIPKLVFSHDVNGTTPDPMFLFAEDRKSAAFNLSFDYQNTLTFDVGYNAFWGGQGNANNFSDRDYVSFSVKYSI